MVTALSHGRGVFRILSFTLIALLFALLSLELRLRTVRSLPQNSVPHSVPKQTLRVLAVGDSITKGLPQEGDYTKELSSLLNASGLCAPIEVINAGVPGIETFELAKQIDELLETYQPAAVITMVGGNDQNQIIDTNWVTFLHRAWRSLRAARFLILQGKKIIQTIEPPPTTPNTLAPVIDFDTIFNRLYKTGEDNQHYTQAFGAHLRREKRYLQALSFHKKMLHRFPHHNAAMLEIGFVLEEQGKFPDAAKAFNRAIEISEAGLSGPYTWGYFALGQLFEKYFKDSEKAEEAYLKALNRLPRWHFSYMFLSDFYRRKGDKRKQEKILLLSLLNSPGNPRLLSELVYFYERNGNEEKSRKYAALTQEAFRKTSATPATLWHYSRLKETIQSKGLLMVVLSYPLQSPTALRDALGEDPMIIYIDNRQRFSEALSRTQYNELFLDYFGGNFGHITKKAAKILAENIAESLLPRIQSSCPKVNTQAQGSSNLAN